MTDKASGVTKRQAENLNRLCGEQVSMKFRKDENQYFCVCRGVFPDRFIMTQIPASFDIEKRLEHGKKVVIRFVESGAVCGFETSVLQYITSPCRLIFFEYPDSIEIINLRAAKRVAVSLKASIRRGGEDLEGSIRDLSKGGCFFAMTYWQDPSLDDISLDSKLSVRFSLPNEKSPIELKCRPVRVIKNEEDLKLGLSFDNDQQELTNKVANFVDFISQLLES